MPVRLVLVLVLGLASPALAQAPKQAPAYPTAIAMRPLVLPTGMSEFRVGALSDFAGQDKSQVRTRLDAAYGIFPRTQIGVDTDMKVNPTDQFAVRDVAAWYEVRLFFSASLRGGAYLQLVRGPGEMGELDTALFGFRFGAPLKFGLSESAALLVMPKWGTEANGQKRQFVELPTGVQAQLIPQLGFYGNAAFKMTDYDPDQINLPAAAGVVLSPVSSFDLGGEYRVDDFMTEKGRLSRWVLVWIGIRT
jgi:hypothetical protein